MRWVYATATCGGLVGGGGGGSGCEGGVSAVLMVVFGQDAMAGAEFELAWEAELGPLSTT